MIIAILSLLYILYLCAECRCLSYRRKKLKYLIHINGIRGKSTVSRLVDAGMRSAGYKVFTKATGSSPRIIDIHNEEYEINRWGKANIREQIKVIHWAVKQGADVLIVECMAIKPVLQKTCESSMLHADIAAITNVRKDHLDEMGKSLDAIASSLSHTIPMHGAFFTADTVYFDFFKKQCGQKDTRAFLSSCMRTSLNSCTQASLNGNLHGIYREIDFPDNVALALDICTYLGADKEKALTAMRTYRKDPGRLKLISYRNAKKQTIFFINILAANDPDSTHLILNRLSKKKYWHNTRYLLVNNRADRMSRLEQYVTFAELHQELFDFLLISGEHKHLFYTLLKNRGLIRTPIVILDTAQYFETIEHNALICAVGNICRSGKVLTDYFEKRGEAVYDI